MHAAFAQSQAPWETREKGMEDTASTKWPRGTLEGTEATAGGATHCSPAYTAWEGPEGRIVGHFPAAVFTHLLAYLRRRLPGKLIRLLWETAVRAFKVCRSGLCNCACTSDFL